jgi:large subunit ribosomal protein L21
MIQPPIFTQNSLAASPTVAKQYALETIEAVNRLRDQIRYYAIAEIVGRPYLITKNDLVVTNRLKDVSVGDVVRLNRVTELGSRDFTIKGQPLVSKDFFQITATVVEQPMGPFVEEIKKKRRCRRRRRITHKQPYTVLRVSELDVKKLA